MNARLSVRAFAWAAALLWGGAVFFVSLLNLFYPDYGVMFLHLASSLYPGYHAEGTFLSLLIGTGYALLDGAVGGFIFAWCYNRLVPKSP